MTLEKKTLLLTLTPVITVLLNIQSILIGLAFIIFLDLLTGVRKSLHVQKININPFKITFWAAVKSKGMRSTWRKTYEYGIGIIVFAVFESMIFKMEPMTIMNHKFSVTELAAVTASLVEIYSIFENMEAVSGSNILKTIIMI